MLQPGPSSPPPKSPPPRELPRLPTSVSNLANRYEPVSSMSNVSRQQTGSPTKERNRHPADYSRIPETSSTATTPSASRYTTAAPAPSPQEIIARRRRIEELEELEMREREHELRVKEREIEQRALELERERQALLNARGTRNDGYTNDGTRATGGPRISTTQRPSIDQQSRYSSSYSQSVTHLVPPSSSSQAPSRQPSSQPSSPGSQSNDHAPYCGCEVCSASKYKLRESNPSQRAPVDPPLMLRPEKPKGGWIRRLSMPVMGNALSLDSKKNGSMAGIAGGPGPYRNSLAFAEEDGRLQTDLTGGIRNRSSTNVARR